MQKSEKYSKDSKIESDKNKKVGYRKLSKNPGAAQQYQVSLRNRFVIIFANGDMEDIEHN